MKHVDFYYDYSCPYAYLAHTQIEAVCARTGADLTWKPMLLGGVFRAVGTAQVPGAAMSAPKAVLNHLDMHRWADHFGVPLRMPETHPNRTVLALRATLASNDIPAASKAFFRAYWVLGRDLSQPDVVRAALDEAGLDGAELLRRAEDPAIKQELRARTDEAIARRVFGAPAFVVTTDGEPELYWGQDRLDLVEAQLGGAPPAPSFPDRAEVDEFSFFFDFSSPFAYLASTQVEALAKRSGARVRYRPFLLGALFKTIGTPDVPLLAMPEAKRAHTYMDMMRWPRRLGVPFKMASRFPMSSVKALRVVLATPEEQRPPLVAALYRAAWAEDRDIANDAELMAIASSVGLDGAALVAATQTPAIKESLRDATIEAQKAGLCGAPSFLVGDLLFWGQDRLLFVEKALHGWQPRFE